MLKHFYLTVFVTTFVTARLNPVFHAQQLHYTHAINKYPLRYGIIHHIPCVARLYLHFVGMHFILVSLLKAKRGRMSLGRRNAM
jgi:hypothetical protein